jgi:superfamily II DNA/RNA helicase
VALLLDHFRPVSTLAFCNTKQQCRDLVDVLRAQGFRRWRCTANWNSASATRC